MCRFNTVQILIATACFAAYILPTSAVAEELWRESYLTPAEAEEVYGTTADAITVEEAQALLLKLVNQARLEAGVPPLAPHPLASVLAQTHADSMATERYVSHFDLAGRKCELRWNSLGQTDHIAENVAYYEINHPVSLTPRFVARIHEHWLLSDDHRENELNPMHTHLGCGFAVVAAGQLTQAAVVAEFAVDYGDYDRLPPAAKPGQTLILQGWLDPQRAQLAYIGLGSEDLPFARDVEYQMSHIGGYSPPEVALAFLPTRYPLWTPDVRYRRRIVATDPQTGEFELAITMEPHWPDAAYYFTVWALNTDQPDEPFCTMTQVVLLDQAEEPPATDSAATLVP